MTLDEFNAKRHAVYREQSQSRLNGIECPKCGSELMDTNPSLILVSFPPKKDINCADCGYRGYRIA